MDCRRGVVVEKGACEGVSYCLWDPSFANGQQGCFLADSAMLSMQQQCIRPASRDILSKLQTCMEARHSCQCSSGSTAAACQARQQQLLAGFRGAGKVCQSLLGCWLSNLNNTAPDVMQLVEVQLGLVQPRIEALRPGANLTSSGTAAAIATPKAGAPAPAPASSSSSAAKLPAAAPASTTTGRRRRALQQALVLSNPVLDDASSSSMNAAVATMPDGYNFESGSYGSAAPSAPASSSAAPAPSVGMNGVILGDGAAAPPAGSTVEYGRNIPGATSSSSGSSGGMNPGYNFESGTGTGTGGAATDGSSSGSSGGSSGGWEFEQAPLDPDKVFGNSSGSGSGSSSDVTMTGGNAPASFWKCAGVAAVKADTTRKWADVDYNSKSLTLATWLKVIQPTSLIDWGVQVMECFKADVNTLSANEAAPTSKPNKESTEYAIVALIRSFSAQADTFRSYLQAGADARATAGLSGLKVLSQQAFPEQQKLLLAKYNASPAYNRDVMLQAAAIIADMQWFAADALALASAPGTTPAQQQQVFEAVVAYGEEMMRRCLYWLFHVQFEGAPAHLPGVPATTAASVALMDAYAGLAAATLPAPAVAADAPAWQQLQGMMAVAAGWASSAASAAAPGKQLSAAELLGNAIDGLAKAHVADFWGTRVELARASASDAARALALADPRTLAPGSAAGGSGSSAGSAAAASAELLLEGTAASELQLSCQAADSSLLLSSMSNSSKSGLAVSAVCEKFLQLPACESFKVAGACSSYSACRWERSSERNLVHTVSGSTAAAAGASSPGGGGVCSMDWVQVLSSGSGAAYTSLGSMIGTCGGIADAAACTAQTMLITLDTSTSGGGAGSIAKVWVPALVVAAVLGLALFGGVMLWRRRSAVARRAAEEARSSGNAAGGGGRGGGGGAGRKAKDGKGGKANKAAVKKKVKRAEPGQYKPDLMRDSFTDYMRSAPQQFENGVALAKAAMAAGSLDAAVAANDVAGARSMQLSAMAADGASDARWYQYPQQPQQQQQQQVGRPGRFSAPQLPPLPPLGSVGMPSYQAGAAAAAGNNAATTSDLIDLQTDVVRNVPNPLQQQQQRAQQGLYGVPSMGYNPAGPGAVWGAAVGAGNAGALGAASRHHRISGGGLSGGLSGGLLSGGLSGEVDLIDTGASLALTSSLGLVSSLPQHASMPIGVADAQQFVLQGQQQQQDDAVVLGLPGPGSMAVAAAPGRRSSGGGARGFSIAGSVHLTSGAASAVGVGAAHSGSLLLGNRGSGDVEDGGASTPTSSCCHDSVCTFRHGPGSSIGSGSIARGPNAAPHAALSTTSSTCWRSGAGGSSSRVGGGRAASASGTQGGAAAGGLGSALSGALSGALSRSSWSSAMSTDMLMSSQHSAAIDP
ncbi:hypothetical protein OEZ86_009685 [Tetradesmus obliquus]|nr:hypothetical protein OEZ86_009685 [Tetradesmus obliquus]